MIRQYWDWVGGNIGAMPLEFLITAIATAVGGYLLRRPLARLVSWLRREQDAALAEARDDARKARAIAADLYRHVTGERHPHAPGRDEGA